MQTLTGKITDIRKPFRENDKEAQVIRIHVKKKVFAYGEIDPKELNGFKEGDHVTIGYNYKDSNNRRITVKSIEHDSSKT